MSIGLLKSTWLTSTFTASCRLSITLTKKFFFPGFLKQDDCKSSREDTQKLKTIIFKHVGDSWVFFFKWPCILDIWFNENRIWMSPTRFYNLIYTQMSKSIHKHVIYFFVHNKISGNTFTTLRLNEKDFTSASSSSANERSSLEHNPKTWLIQQPTILVVIRIK